MTPGARRGLAVTILVLLAAGAGVGVAPVIGLHRETGEAIAAARARLADLGGRRLDPQALEARRNAVAALPPERAGLLVASEAEAGARLEAHLRRLAAQHGAEIVALRPAPFATEEGVRVYRASLQMRAPDTAVPALLRALEAGAPALVFESLVVRRPEAAGEGLRLEVTGTLRAYLEPPPAPTPAPERRA